jgi:hypothetical protein
MTTDGTFRHPRTERWLRRISHALKHGMAAGGLCSLALYFIESHDQQSWVPLRRFALSLVIFCSVGVLFNLVRFNERQKS